MSMQEVYYMVKESGRLELTKFLSPRWLYKSMVLSSLDMIRTI